MNASNISNVFLYTTSVQLQSGITSTINPGTADNNSKGLSVQSCLLIFAFILIILIGTIGNCLVCYFFGWKRRGHMTVPDKLFLYLGIVDLLSSLLNPVVYVYFETTQYDRWDFGIFGCKFLVPLGPISTTLSSFLIQIIAVDRYFVILSPFGRRYSGKYINYCVILAIIISILLYVYYIFMLQVPISGGTCRIVDVTDKRYSVPAVVSILIQDCTLIPVILFTNISIIRKLKEDKELNSLGQVSSRQNKRQEKLMKMLMVIVCVFLVLVLPRDIFHLAFTFSWMFPAGITYNITLKNINTVVKIMSTANSCVNVFIYSKMHQHFRISVFDMLRRCARQAQHQEDRTSHLLDNKEGAQAVVTNTSNIKMNTSNNLDNDKAVTAL